MSMIDNELYNRLTKRIIICDDGCWEWQGCCGSHGYGQITYKMKGNTTHRAMYQALGIDIPEGLFVLHKCDYRRCINPEHLFLGTPEDNIQDMIAKGRDAIRNGIKLSDEQVKTIKKMLIDGIKVTKVAVICKTSHATVSRINTGQSYGWVDV